MDQEQPHNHWQALTRELRTLREQVKLQSQQIAHLDNTLKQLFEITLLPETERHAHAARLRSQKLNNLKERIHRVIAHQQYEQLEGLIGELQTSFANDPQAEEIRLSAWARRDAALATAVTHLNERVEGMMSIAQWQPAMDTVREQIARFGDQSDLVALLQRIEREYHAWREVAVNRIYAVTREAIDRREWRRALKSAEEIASRFSDHPRAMKIIQQLSTIRENAEIEHRQEMERNIQQFIRSRRFDDAIATAEELILQYPLSPQAAECRALVPKLEGMAMQDEADQLGSV